MSVVLYGMEYSSACMAVLVTAKIIDIEVHLKEINTLKGEQLTESYKKINPAHTIPTLEDKDLHIWESRAIMCYLVQQYSKDDYLYPKDIKKKALVDNMLYFDATSLNTSFAKYFYPHLFGKKPLDPEVEVTVKDRLSVLDGILSKESFVAGGDKPSLADISIRCSLFVPSAIGYSLEPYPNVIKWMARFEAAIPFFKEFSAPGFKYLHDFLQNMIATQAADA